MIAGRVSRVVADARKRKVRGPAPIDTYRCARLAAPDLARDDLESVGRAPYPADAAPKISKRMAELVQLIHHVDIKVFGRDPSTRDDRYSKGFNAFYGGEQRHTAQNEIRHYVVTRFVIDSPEQEEFELDVFVTEFLGSFRDLCGLEAKHRYIVDDKDKRVPQGVGAALSAERGLTGLRVPSARHKDKKGVCFANIVGFDKDALTPIRVIGTLSIDVPYDKLGRRRPFRQSFTPRS